MVQTVPQNAGKPGITFARLSFHYKGNNKHKEGEKMKYKDWLNEWLENYIKPTAKIKTYARYAEIVERHIIPHLGDVELDEISALVIQKYVTHLSANGNLKTGKELAPNSVNAIITVVQNSLKMAYTLGYVKEYVGDKVKRPKAQEKKIECFSSAEQKQIEAYVMGGKTKLFGIVLCLYTGLRIGELLALEWSDVDFGKAELHVSKTCHDGKDKNGVFCRIVDTPKTSSSIRTIPLPRQIIPLLREVKKNSHSIYVVSNGEKSISIRSYQRSFNLILRNLNLPHRGFHSLRHTFATRALECGMDVKTLSEILGHKTPTVTLNRYVHSLMEHKKEMMNRLGKFL